MTSQIPITKTNNRLGRINVNEFDAGKTMIKPFGGLKNNLKDFKGNEWMFNESNLKTNDP